MKMKRNVILKFLEAFVPPSDHLFLGASLWSGKAFGMRTLKKTFS